MLKRILKAIESVRAPVVLTEYDLHETVCQTLARHGIPCKHEAVLAPRCRVDVLCGDVAIELKRGKPTRAALIRQLTRYAQTRAVSALIVVSEHAVELPEQIEGIPVRCISLYRLWGVSHAAGNPRTGVLPDSVLVHADDALRAAQDALGITGNESLLMQQTEYEDDETPLYMQDIPQSAHYYGTLSYNARRKSWTLRAEPCVLELCKRLFPGSETGKRGEARFAAHRRLVGDINWLMLRYPLEVAPRDRERWQRAIHEARTDAVVKKQLLETPSRMQAPTGMFLGELKPFQEIGLNWLVHTKRALLADEMGLGKTLQALCCLCATNAFPAILVVPPHLVRNWAAEIQRFIRMEGRLPRVHVIKGLSPYELPEADIYILHYLLLRGWKKILPHLGFRAVVFDEVQELRRAGTEKYSAASLLAESADRVMGLSGTPIYNQGGEIWNVVNILDYHFLGDWESFTREWCYGYGNNIVIKPELLGEYLRSEGLMLRRTKAQVLPELPEKRRLVQEIDADDAVYKRLMTPVLDKLRLLTNDGEMTASARALLMDQICQGERQATGVAKAPYVCQFVRALLENGEKVLLFAHHHALMDIYRTELKPFSPVFITGRETGMQKEKAVDDFMQGKTDLCCISLRAAAGLNLQKATCVVFGELDWSPAVHSQAEDRAHRIGQQDSLLCYYLVSPRGSDADVQEALGLKVSQFLGLMGETAQEDGFRQAEADFARKYVEKLLHIQEKGGLH